MQSRSETDSNAVMERDLSTIGSLGPVYSNANKYECRILRVWLGKMVTGSLVSSPRMGAAVVEHLTI